MWKKIDTNLVLSGLIVGKIITDDTNDPANEYEVINVNARSVEALHLNTKTLFIVFPIDELLSGKWWVKDEKATR